MKKPRIENVHPSKDVCEMCRDHGLCLAEDGKPSYQCRKTRENVNDIL